MRSAGAAAFTMGPGIGVAVGPTDPIPTRLLTHELIHVAQQTRPGDALPEAAEVQAARGAGDLSTLGPLVETGRSAVAFAPEDWLAGTPDLRGFGFTELVDELRAVDEWIDRQTHSSDQTDRLFEAKAALQAEIVRRRKAMKPSASHRRASDKIPATAEVGPHTEMPSSLRAHASVELKDPAEIRLEVDRLIAWLQRPGLSRADRAVLQESLRLLAPTVSQDLDRASASRRQARVSTAFAVPAGADRSAIMTSIRTIDAIQPLSAQPGMAFVMHEGELVTFPVEIGEDCRRRAVEGLIEASLKLKNMNDTTVSRMDDHLQLNYRDQVAVGFAVSVWSGEEPIEVQDRMARPLAESTNALARFTQARRRGSLTDMARSILDAGDASQKARDAVDEGIGKAMVAAGAIANALTITKELSYALVLAIGTILAAPIAASYVAGTGATGLLATGLTTGLTGGVVGAEGYALGFTGGALGEAAAGGDARSTLHAGRDEGWKYGKQGFTTGLGGGATAGIGKNLMVGSSELTRSVVSQAGGNALGAMTHAAVSDVPKGETRLGATVRAGLWGGGLGVFGGIAGESAKALSSPAARVTVGYVLPSAAGAGATYAQTGDVVQALGAGGLGLATSAIATRANARGETPGMKLAFDAGQGTARGIRNITAAAMIGLGQAAPAFRLGSSSTPTMIGSGPEGYGETRPRGIAGSDGHATAPPASEHDAAPLRSKAPTSTSNEQTQQTQQTQHEEVVPATSKVSTVDQDAGPAATAGLAQELVASLPGAAPQELAVLQSLSPEAWNRILSYARTNSKVSSVKGIIAEEVFLLSSEFQSIRAKVVARAAAMGISEEQVRFVRDARGLAPTRTGSGSNQELTDGMFVAEHNGRLHILAVLESKSPSNLRDLASRERESLGQIGWDFERLSENPVTIGSTTYLPDQVSVGRTKTDWIGIAPQNKTLSKGTLGKIGEQFPGFQLVRNPVSNDVLDALAGRVVATTKSTE